MIRPSLDSGPVALAAYVARLFCDSHRLAYAHLAPDLKIVHASPNFAPLLTTAAAAPMEGQALTDLLEEFVGAEEALAAVLSGKEAVYRLDRINRQLPDGSTVYLSFQVIPFNDLYPEAGLLLIAEETTTETQLEQRLVQDRNELRLLQVELAQANEQLQHLNRLKSFFVSMAAHDMRLPLTAIKGYSEMLLDFLPNEHLDKQRHFTAIIHSQAHRLGQLLNGLLDVEQIEQGKLVLKLSEVNLGTAVQEAMNGLNVMALNRNLSLLVELPEQEVQIQADAERVEQILYNLISNGLKYTRDEGYVRVSLHCQNGQAVIDVADNGLGMTSEQMDKLFEPYYRTDEARKSRATGAGIGLFIAKTLAEAHHGSIAVESKRGQGSTFTVRLPLRQPLP